MINEDKNVSEYIGSFSEDLIARLQEVFGDQLESIIVYGSVARGMQTDQSDIDIALIMKIKMDEAHEDKLSDFVVDMNLKYDRVFSVIDIDEDAYEKWGNASPFYRNVKNEGVVIWKAA